MEHRFSRVSELEAENAIYDVLSLKFSECTILDAQNIIGGALILRFVRLPEQGADQRPIDPVSGTRCGECKVIPVSEHPLRLLGIRPGPGTIVPVPYPLPIES